MNEQLQAALLSILHSTINAATVAKDFLMAEIPEVIRQLLVWHAVEAGVLALCFLVPALLLVGAFWKNREWCFEELGPLNLFILFGVIGLSSGAVVNGLTVLKIWIAPKLYLIEYAARLVK